MKNKDKNCKNCVWKYSCGYSSLNLSQPERKCIEPHLFRKKRKNVWSLKNQKFEPENIVKKQRNGE